jgi:hypothetical protein
METNATVVWYDELPARYPWSSLWHRFYRCSCGGLCSDQSACPVCGLANSTEPSFSASGSNARPMYVVAGAEGRYEDYVYLDLMEREWRRPALEASTSPRPSVGGRVMADKVGLVLLFWTYFESRITRLVEMGLFYQPADKAESLRERYRSVGARMDRLYRILFSTTYEADLVDTGFASISSLLNEVQSKRNAFSHGDPVAIDDALVERLVALLRDEHISWIAVYNRRVSALRAQAIAQQE